MFRGHHLAFKSPRRDITIYWHSRGTNKTRNVHIVIIVLSYSVWKCIGMRVRRWTGYGVGFDCSRRTFRRRSGATGRKGVATVCGRTIVPADRCVNRRVVRAGNTGIAWSSLQQCLINKRVKENPLTVLLIDLLSPYSAASIGFPGIHTNRWLADCDRSGGFSRLTIANFFLLVVLAGK